MSRIGKQEILIPTGVEVKKDGLILTVKGPKGTLSRNFRDDIDILRLQREENVLQMGSFLGHPRGSDHAFPVYLREFGPYPAL